MTSFRQSMQHKRGYIVSIIAIILLLVPTLIVLNRKKGERQPTTMTSTEETMLSLRSTSSTEETMRSTGITAKVTPLPDPSLGQTENITRATATEVLIPIAVTRPNGAYFLADPETLEPVEDGMVIDEQGNIYYEPGDGRKILILSKEDQSSQKTSTAPPTPTPG